MVIDNFIELQTTPIKMQTVRTVTGVIDTGLINVMITILRVVTANNKQRVAHQKARRCDRDLYVARHDQRIYGSSRPMKNYDMNEFRAHKK